MIAPTEGPPADCPLCPRLVSLRAANSARWPDWHNGPVASFGATDAKLLIVGLAPGLKGANRTGRPFTGDYAGGLLYETLVDYGLAAGVYGASADDGLALPGCRIANAVRCLPPGNKPIGAEVKACAPFLAAEIASLGRLRAVLALGGLAHGAVLSALGLKKSACKFAHAARHDLKPGLVLFDSYHCSRYNTNTRRLTTPMFRAVFDQISQFLGPF